MPVNNTRVTRCIGGIAHDTNGRLLMVRRANAPGQGLWSIPGGRVEPGESDEQAVTRELKEETGLCVIVGRLIGSVTRPAVNGLYAIHDYACQAISGELVAGDDAAEVTWMDAATFATLVRTNALTEGLEQALTSWNALPQ
jgi:8-oxo-dGTP diphosphatase